MNGNFDSPGHGAHRQLRELLDHHLRQRYGKPRLRRLAAVAAVGALIAAGLAFLATATGSAGAATQSPAASASTSPSGSPTQSATPTPSPSGSPTRSATPSPSPSGSPPPCHVTIKKTWIGPKPIGRNQPPEKYVVPVTWQYQAVTNVRGAKFSWTTKPSAFLSTTSQQNRVLTNQYMHPGLYVITVTVTTPDGTTCSDNALTPLTDWQTDIKVAPGRTGLSVSTVPKQVQGQIWANCGIWHTVNGKPERYGKSTSVPIKSSGGATRLIPVSRLPNGTWTLVCYINNQAISSQQEAEKTAYGQASLTFPVVKGSIPE